MANKRMFSKQITTSDAFLDMPTSSQLLYFHLNMEADDDGFVANPKRLIRMLGANDDDFKILLAKRFILAFASGVIVIKHWLLHNAVRKDMYKETQYLEEKKLLQIKDNKAYTELRNETVTIPLHRIGQDRLGQDRIDIVADKPRRTLKKDINEPMTLQEFYIYARSCPQKHIQIIGEWADTTKPSFTTYGQWQKFIKRNLRPAKDLEPYTDEQLKEAFEKIETAKKEGWLKKYTLETLGKFL